MEKAIGIVGLGGVLIFFIYRVIAYYWVGIKLTFIVILAIAGLVIALRFFVNEFRRNAAEARRLQIKQDADAEREMQDSQRKLTDAQLTNLLKQF